MTTILVIEDDANLRTFLKDALESEGYSVNLASNGERGLVACQETPPDLILTDLIMPGRSGIEVLRTLRTESSAPPIVAMSGGWRHGDDNLSLASLLGARAVLHKPFTLEKLFATLTTVLHEQNNSRH